MARKMPELIDLSNRCGPVQDQGPLGSSVACAMASMIEFNEQSPTPPSRLFIYWHARKLDEG